MPTLVAACLVPTTVAAQESLPFSDYYRLDGRIIDFDDARAAQRERELARPKFARSVLESAGMLGLGSIWYWASRDLNSQDWDVDADFASVSRRFTTLQHIRFDSNDFWVNEGHVAAGAAYYLAPRSSGFGPLGALAFSALTSAVWEWGIEFREHVSINDLVTSPYGGQAFGEVLHKLGAVHRVMSSELSFPARAFTTPFAAPHAFHDWLDGVGRPDWPPSLGPPMFHDFRTGGGVRVLRSDDETSLVGTLRLDTTVVDLPGYRRPGRFENYFADGNYTRFRLDLGIGDRGIDTFEVSARAMLLGHYQQRISETGRGWSLLFGLNRGAWIVTENRSGFRDQLGMVDLFGPLALLTGYLGPLRLGAELSGFLEFGTVRSQAFDAVRTSFPQGAVRTELDRNGYYFAWGTLLLPAVWAELGPVRVGVDGEWLRVSELNLPDRVHQTEVPRPVDLLDQRFEIGAHLDVTPRPWLTLRGSLRRRIRTSRLDDAEPVRDRLDEVAARVLLRY